MTSGEHQDTVKPYLTMWFDTENPLMFLGLYSSNILRQRKRPRCGRQRPVVVVFITVWSSLAFFLFFGPLQDKFSCFVYFSSQEKVFFHLVGLTLHLILIFAFSLV